MAIKAVIFDADGVLINGEMFSRQLEKEYGIPVSKTTTFFETDFPKCLIGGGDLKEELGKHIESWGWKGTVDDLLEYWFKAEHKLDEPLVGYIKELKQKGIKVYLATNNEKYRTQYMLERMDFANIFDKVYSSAHLGLKKPNQEFFGKILSDISPIAAYEVLFWDDSEENVEGARNVGINAEFYKNFEDCKTETDRYLSTN